MYVQFLNSGRNASCQPAVLLIRKMRSSPASHSCHRPSSHDISSELQWLTSGRQCMLSSVVSPCCYPGSHWVTAAVLLVWFRYDVCAMGHWSATDDAVRPAIYVGVPLVGQRPGCQDGLLGQWVGGGAGQRLTTVAAARN